MNKSKNAYRGRNIELLFRNSIGDHPTVIEAIKKAYSLKGEYRIGISSGIHSEKRDVTLEFTDGRNIDANVKSYGKWAYNQMTRTSVENFCDKFELPCKDWLKTLLVNKAKNVKLKLFPEIEQERAIEIFQPKIREIIKWSLSAKASREIFVLFDNEENLFRIYKMIDVLKHMDYKIRFTDRGNMQIGYCIIFQRKGGNGKNAEHLRKDDIQHPGNNVQLKMKMGKFVEGMERYKLTSYKV